MTEEQLRDKLSGLGISPAVFARLVDVTPRAVNMWLIGDRSVPGPVAAYVNLLATLPQGMRAAELAKLTKERPVMKDGMYMINYAGTAGHGAGMLVFDSGRVYGADVARGRYDGELVYNDTTGFADLTLRVQMPANQPSVIGITQPFEWILNVSTSLDPNKEAGQMTVQTDLGQPISANYQFLRPLPQDA